jgi:hypothetical protein
VPIGLVGLGLLSSTWDAEDRDGWIAFVGISGLVGVLVAAIGIRNTRLNVTWSARVRMAEATEEEGSS